MSQATRKTASQANASPLFLGIRETKQNANLGQNIQKSSAIKNDFSGL